MREPERQRVVETRGRADSLLRRRRTDKDDDTIGMGNVKGRVLAKYRARNHKLPRGM